MKAATVTRETVGGRPAWVARTVDGIVKVIYDDGEMVFARKVAGGDRASYNEGMGKYRADQRRDDAGRFAEEGGTRAREARPLVSEAVPLFSYTSGPFRSTGYRNRQTGAVIAAGSMHDHGVLPRGHVVVEEGDEWASAARAKETTWEPGFVDREGGFHTRREATRLLREWVALQEELAEDAARHVPGKTKPLRSEVLRRVLTGVVEKYREDQLRDEGGRFAEEGGGRRSAPLAERTPEFREWFGDSVVVNEDGSPKIVYHGTDVDISSFRPNSHFGTGNAASDRASALASFDRHVGRPVRPYNVVPVYLSLQNPLRMPDLAAINDKGEPVDEHAPEGSEEGTPRGWEGEEAVATTLLEMGIIDIDEFEEHRSNAKAFQLLREKGYDGIVYENAIEDPGSDSYIVFDPANVKSIFNARPSRQSADVTKYNPDQPRDDGGRWTRSGGGDGPGEYGGRHRPPGPESGAPAHDLTANGIYPADVYSMGERFYGTGDSVADRESLRVLHDVAGNPDAKVTIYRAVPADVDDDEINPGDWVTLSPTYAEQHGARFPKGSRVVEMTVRARDIFTNGDSINEFGYWPQPRGRDRDVPDWAKWDEAEHPRDERGRFTESGEGGDSAWSPARATARARRSASGERSAGGDSARPGEDPADWPKTGTELDEAVEGAETQAEVFARVTDWFKKELGVELDWSLQNPAAFFMGPETFLKSPELHSIDEFTARSVARIASVLKRAKDAGLVMPDIVSPGVGISAMLAGMSPHTTAAATRFETGPKAGKTAIAVIMDEPGWDNANAIAAMAAEGWHPSAAKDSALVHELGHVQFMERIADKYGLTSKKWMGTDPSPKHKEIAMTVSRYASTNTAEFVAETFVGLASGKKYSDKVMRMYRSMGMEVPPLLLDEPSWHREKEEESS